MGGGKTGDGRREDGVRADLQKDETATVADGEDDEDDENENDGNLAPDQSQPSMHNSY